MGFYLLLFFLWGEQRKRQKGRQEAVGGRCGRREEEKEEVWVDGRRKEGSGSREAGGAGGGLGGVAHISTKAGVLSGKVRGSDRKIILGEIWENRAENINRSRRLEKQQ